MDLEELNIASLQLSLASQEARAVDVAEAYTRRIDEIDRSGPCLRSVVELSPDLLQDSKRCDEQLANGEDPGPLHGVQLLVNYHRSWWSNCLGGNLHLFLLLRRLNSTQLSRRFHHCQ